MSVVTEPTKVCSRCGERKPWSGFYIRKRQGIPQSYCKQCSVVSAMERQAQNPKRTREAQARKYQNAKADPERAAIYRAYSRDSRRRRHNIPPERWRRSRYMNTSTQSPAVDAAPFVEWLRTLDSTSVAGLQSGTARKLLNGEQATIFLDTVDAALIRANTLTTLDDLYPMEVAA